MIELAEERGFDFPDVRILPPDGEILYKQMRGRGTRLCAGKRLFLMLDFVGNEGSQEGLCHCLR